MATTSRDVHPSRSQTIEKYLTDRGFTWEYRIDVPMSKFDKEKSLRNQARIGNPLDRGTVDRYITDLGNGDVFPAIIAAETSKSAPLLVADGNHRYTAHEGMGRKTIDAYVVLKATPQAVTMLTFEANTRHGLATNEATRLVQALYLMDNNHTAEDVARRLGLKPSTVRAAAALSAVDRRAEEVGLSMSGWSGLPASIKTRLGQIQTDEGFAALGKLVISADLRTEEVAKAVNDMAGLRSSTKQVEYVAALRVTYAENLQTGGKPADRKPFGRQAKSGRQRFGMALGQLSALSSPADIVGRMTEDDKPEWIRRTDAAIKQLEAIREALKK